MCFKPESRVSEVGPHDTTQDTKSIAKAVRGIQQVKIQVRLQRGFLWVLLVESGLVSYTSRSLPGKCEIAMRKCILKTLSCCFKEYTAFLIYNQIKTALAV